jgi:acylphosphatase
MPARRLVVRGLVQGVGFRYATRTEARRLGLRGWVRNRADGSVEVVAVGAEPELDALARWAGRGPRGARVDAVEASALDADALDRVEPPVGDHFRQVDSAGW